MFDPKRQFSIVALGNLHPTSATRPTPARRALRNMIPATSEQETCRLYSTAVSNPEMYSLAKNIRFLAGPICGSIKARIRNPSRPTYVCIVKQGLHSCAVQDYIHH